MSDHASIYLSLRWSWKDGERSRWQSSGASPPCLDSLRRKQPRRGSGRHLLPCLFASNVGDSSIPEALTEYVQHYTTIVQPSSFPPAQGVGTAATRRSGADHIVARQGVARPTVAHSAQPPAAALQPTTPTLAPGWPALVTEVPVLPAPSTAAVTLLRREESCDTAACCPQERSALV
jgi:hypothetical protein